MVFVASGTSFWTRASSRRFTALEEHPQWRVRSQTTQTLPSSPRRQTHNNWHWTFYLFILIKAFIEMTTAQMTSHRDNEDNEIIISRIMTHSGREYLANHRRASFKVLGPSWYHVCWHCNCQTKRRKWIFLYSDDFFYRTCKNPLDPTCQILRIQKNILSDFSV